MEGTYIKYTNILDFYTLPLTFGRIWNTGMIAPSNHYVCVTQMHEKCGTLIS